MIPSCLFGEKNNFFKKGKEGVGMGNETRVQLGREERCLEYGLEGSEPASELFSPLVFSEGL